MKNNLIKTNKNGLVFDIEECLPIGSVVVNINSENYYICIIRDQEFETKVVVCNQKGKIIKTILDNIDKDSVNITRDNDHFYLACSNHYSSTLYKFSLSDYSLKETRDFFHSDLASICVNEKSIYLFDALEGYIYELGKNLKTIDRIDANEYKGNTISHTFTYIAALKDGFTSVALFKDEEEYNKLKAFLFHKFGKRISNSNDFISSIAYDKNNNIGYISFYNFLVIINETGIDSILKFKNKGIVSLSYDDIDSDSLVICFSDLNSNKISGHIRSLNKKEIDNLKIPVSVKNKTNISKGYKKIR